MTEHHPVGPASASPETAIQRRQAAGPAVFLPRGPWCCEKGQAQRMTVCPDCARLNALYSECY